MLLHSEVIHQKVTYFEIDIGTNNVCNDTRQPEHVRFIKYRFSSLDILQQE